MVAAGRRVAVGLGAVGAVCLLLGGCLLLAGPAIVKEQVLKVSGPGAAVGGGGCAGLGVLLSALLSALSAVRALRGR